MATSRTLVALYAIGSLIIYIEPPSVAALKSLFGYIIIMEIKIPDNIIDEYIRKLDLCNYEHKINERIINLIKEDLSLLQYRDLGIDPLTKCLTKFKLDDEIYKLTFLDNHTTIRKHYLCIDIDYFKKYIDDNSFSEGDNILIEIGELLKLQYGENNVFRYGGDEFVIELKDKKYNLLNYEKVKLKYSIVNLKIIMNHYRKHHILFAIKYYIDKGICDSKIKINKINHTISCK